MNLKHEKLGRTCAAVRPARAREEHLTPNGIQLFCYALHVSPMPCDRGTKFQAGMKLEFFGARHILCLGRED